MGESDLLPLPPGKRNRVQILKPAHVFKWMPVKLVWKKERRCIYCGLSKEELKRLYG